MGEVQGQGYIDQALGVADVLAASYFHAMTYRPDEPGWEGRDRFLLFIGHYATALYAVLMKAGILPREELETYGMDDSRMHMRNPWLHHGVAPSGSTNRHDSSPTCANRTESRALFSSVLVLAPVRSVFTKPELTGTPVPRNSWASWTVRA
jgi:hypothetical protein